MEPPWWPTSARRRFNPLPSSLLPSSLLPYSPLPYSPLPYSPLPYLLLPYSLHTTHYLLLTTYYSLHTTHYRYVSAVPCDIFKRLLPKAWAKMPYFRQVRGSSRKK